MSELPVRQRSSIKGKERELNASPQPTDLDEKLTALRRRNAGPIRAKERLPFSQTPATQSATPQPQSRSPRQPVQLPASTSSRQLPSSPRRAAFDADHDDFSRRLKISSPPAPSSRSVKLFNPDSDPVHPRRTAEPEAMSDATSSSYPSRPAGPSASHSHRDAPSRQLFDHRKDDPVRFSVLVRPQRDRPVPTPKSSGDYISASSTSSYANSVSSAFTLSSTTDGSSASSALFDRNGSNQNKTEDSGSGNAFSLQLKKLYRTITNLETKVKMEDAEDRDAEDSQQSSTTPITRVTLKGKEPPEPVKISEEDLEREKWKNQIADHKQLAETMRNLLEISSAPSVPASLRTIPKKYNIIVRLWTFGFHRLLESLRRASFTSPLALEHLQEFIYYAYTFYTGLLEEPTLEEYRNGWLEALGDLARYRMAVAAMMVNGSMVGGAAASKLSRKPLTTEAMTEGTASSGNLSSNDNSNQAQPTSLSDKPAARVDDSPSPSVGIAAARLLEVEPETERWCNIAREWYGAGLAGQPGTGKLHHHLGLLCREVGGDELRGIYHFVKSMTTLHPFPTSRESVLPIWSPTAQTQRSRPDVDHVTDLFVLLQGMIFTHVQLDDFQPTLARFIERLDLEGAEERAWIMMAIINIGALFEYGRPSGLLRKVSNNQTTTGSGVETALKVMIRKSHGSHEDERMDIDEPKQRDHATKTSPIIHHSMTHPMSPAPSEAGTDELHRDEEDLSPSLKYALQLTFSMLSFVLKHPTRKSSPFARSMLNPYLTILLTFLATILKNPRALAILERSIPWQELALFFATVPRKVMSVQGLLGSNIKKDGEHWAMLASGCTPLPEDWCMRGMEWVGRRVFPSGYWKIAEDKKEMEVLDTSEGGDLFDGHIEDDADDGMMDANEALYGRGHESSIGKRWVRIMRSAVGIATVVDGFHWTEGTREWCIQGKLAHKVQMWTDLDRIEKEAEERRRMGTRWTDDAMDIDEESDTISEEEEDENDTDEVRALKARRRYLQDLLKISEHSATMSPPRPSMQPKFKKPPSSRSPAAVVPGYTILVVDTNVLLSSLSLFTSLIESLRWTIVIPLPVIMELDGLSNSSSAQLSETAQEAVSYISSHLRSHSTSLKVQTSKGNYLTTLTVRTEQVDFDRDSNWERNMDDLILKAAIWQEDHWVDRSALLKSTSKSTTQAISAIKVVLLSLDRNLRLKARSKHLPAASEKELAAILANAT